MWICLPFCVTPIFVNINHTKDPKTLLTISCYMQLCNLIISGFTYYIYIETFSWPVEPSHIWAAPLVSISMSGPAVFLWSCLTTFYSPLSPSTLPTSVQLLLIFLSTLSQLNYVINQFNWTANRYHLKRIVRSKVLVDFSLNKALPASHFCESRVLPTSFQI